MDLSPTQFLLLPIRRTKSTISQSEMKDLDDAISLWISKKYWISKSEQFPIVEKKLPGSNFKKSRHLKYICWIWTHVSSILILLLMICICGYRPLSFSFEMRSNYGRRYMWSMSICIHNCNQDVLLHEYASKRAIKGIR